MNRIKILIFIITFYGCKSTKTDIKVSQIKTDYPVILKYNKNYNKFSRIKIPLKLKIYNDSNQQYSFASIRYEYNSKLGGIIETVYEEINKKLKEIKNNQRKYIDSKESKEFIIYTSHRLDSSNIFQQNFKAYRTQNKNIETLNIGTINNFKLNNEKLLKLLTQNDSIFINSWKSKDITIPIKW